MGNNHRRNRYIKNNRNHNSTPGTRKLVSLLLMVLILAVCIVSGILALRKEAGFTDGEKAISMEEIEGFLAELPQETREGFRELCRQTEAERGYLPYEETLENLIDYAGESSPELELGYKNLGLLSISGNTILTRDKKSGLVKSYVWYENKEGEVSAGQLLAGDEITILGTKDKALLLLEKKESALTLEAAWILSGNGDRIAFKFEEHTIELANNTPDYRGYEDIADIRIEKGGITQINVYTDKINARLLSIKEGTIELEGLGEIPYTDKIQVYKLFGTYEPYTLSDLKIGYSFADFVRNDEGEIVAALVQEEGYLDKIRVVIKTTEFASAYHETVSLMCDTDMEWKSGEKSGVIYGGEEITIDSGSDFFRTNRIVFTPRALSGKTAISSISRSQGTPSYRGSIEIEKCEEGLLVINELLLDEYLYSVVPSEMPSHYPLEALKAQAVSARTYAYTHMSDSRLQSYGAHVDDSAAFQVYNNIVESDTCTRAVRETEGIIVSKDGGPVTTYFYSTSCGYGTDLTAWNVENDSYLKARKITPGEMEKVREETAESREGIPGDQEETKESGEETTAEVEPEAMQDEEAFSTFIKQYDDSCYEAEETYFRWKYETPLNVELLTRSLQKRYEANPHQVLTETSEGFVQKEIPDIEKVYGIKIISRAEGGVATELLIEADKAVIKVISEKNVRYILANESTQLRLGNAYTKEGSVNGMLPSAFVTIEPAYGDDNAEMTENKAGISGYTVWGGGFGHGIGMSQNGARQMAEHEMDYRDILQFFYVGTSLENLKE